MNKISYTRFRLTEPHENNSNPASYSMRVPIVGAGSNNDTNNKLTDEHALDGVSTSAFVGVRRTVCTYQHCLQELEVYDRPCPAA